jgi:hypothetical protein
VKLHFHVNAFNHIPGLSVKKVRIVFGLAAWVGGWEYEPISLSVLLSICEDFT